MPSPHPFKLRRMTMNPARLLPSAPTAAEAAAASATFRPSLSPRSGSQEGFTLIELLVGIAIIAILAALLFPVVQGMRARGWEVQEIQNLRSIHQATMLYAGSNNGKLPLQLDKSKVSEGVGWQNLWVDQIEPFLPKSSGKVTTEGGRNPAFYSPVVKPQDRWVADYAPNDRLIPAFTPQSSGSVNIPLAAIQTPSRKLLFFEGGKAESPRTRGAFVAPWSEIVRGNMEHPNTIARRHGSDEKPAFFGIFVDGHVERFDFHEFVADEERRRELFSKASD